MCTLNESDPLQKSQSQLAESQRIAHIGSWDIDLETGIMTWSDELYRIYDVDPKTFSLTQESFLELIHPDDRHRMVEWITALLSLQKPEELIFRRILSDGTIRTISGRGELQLNAEGKPIRAVGTAQDITEHILVRETLQRSEKKYGELYESMRDAFVRIDMMGNILEFNTAFKDMVGYSDTEILTLTNHEITPTKWHEDEERIVANQIIPRGYSDVYEKEYLRKDGTVIPVELRMFLLRNEQGVSLNMLAIVRDISERKRMEEVIRKNAEQLRQSEVRFRRLFEEDLTGDFVKTPDGTITMCNSAFARIFGFSSVESAVGTNIKALYADPAERESLRLRILSERKVEQVELAMKTVDGRKISVLENAVGHFNEEGELIEIAGYIIDNTARKEAERILETSNTRLHLLATVVNHLAGTRSLEEITAIVRTAARQITGAEGATFVIREGETCYYADEDAISPLWKGQRFPLHACISGWTMLNHQPAVISDVYADDRIPTEAYKPTFVKSLAMVPIRVSDPIGSIGVYWSTNRTLPETELRLLQTLAEATAIALENMKLYDELEQRVRQRTSQLEAANRELEAFAYSVSHDLRAPLRSIDGFSQALLEDYADKLDDQGKNYLGRVRTASQRMAQLIDDLLQISRVTRVEMNLQRVNLSAIAEEVAEELKKHDQTRRVEFHIQPDLFADADPPLIRVLMENLLGNAWKFTSKKPNAHIEFGQTEEDGKPVFFVRDDGAGFDMQYADKLFGAFQRLHSTNEFPGTGIGLTSVQRILHRHGGEIHAIAEVDRGATFFFTLR